MTCSFHPPPVTQANTADRGRWEPPPGLESHQLGPYWGYSPTHIPPSPTLPATLLWPVFLGADTVNIGWEASWLLSGSFQTGFHYVVQVGLELAG